MMQRIHALEAQHIQGNGGAQPLHCHEEIEFAAVCEGTGSLRSRGARYNTGPGLLSVVLPQEPHAGVPGTTEFAVKVLNVSWDWFERVGLDWRALPQSEALSPNPAALAAFHEAHTAILTNEAPLRQEDHLLTLYEAFRPLNNNRAGREPKPIALALEILRERLAEPITLVELSALVGLTPWHLCRAFRDTVGLPPHAYQNSLRVARAKTLLQQGQTPGEIAGEVGFYDQSHLIRHCKRFLNQTPTEIARTAISSKTRLFAAR